LPRLKTVRFDCPEDTDVDYFYKTYPSKCIVGEPLYDLSVWPFPMAELWAFSFERRNPKPLSPHVKVIKIRPMSPKRADNFIVSEIKNILPNVTEIYFEIYRVNDLEIWKSKFEEIESTGIKIISEKTWNQRKEEFANDEWWIEIQ
jgi:hypothetical protein